MKKYLIILGIVLIALITIASIKPRETLIESAPDKEYVPVFENVTKEYIAAIMDEVSIELFGLDEEEINVDGWMVHPFDTTTDFEEPLLVEDWMTKPFLTEKNS